jgi:hypothetical protein
LEPVSAHPARSTKEPLGSQGEEKIMNIGKVLAVSAVAGMLLGTAACGGATPAAATDPTATGGEKKSCSGDKKSCSGDKKSCSAAGAASGAAPAATAPAK